MISNATLSYLVVTVTACVPDVIASWDAKRNAAGEITP